MNPAKYSFIFLSCIYFLACSADNETSSNIDVRTLPDATCAETYSEEAQMCTELYMVDDVEEHSPHFRAALMRSKKWNPGQTIKIKFLNGNSYLHENVKRYASVWLKYANLKFEYVDANAKADVKIGFKWACDYSSWSYIGTDCKTISQSKPSINFGWFDDETTQMEFQRVVMHEFGHLLGLIHEHQHPEAGIEWNKDYVYEYYYAVNKWDKEKVDINIFNKYSTSQTNYSDFDENSIMMYAINRRFTLNGYSIDWNYTLSDTDIQFISEMYPY